MKKNSFISFLLGLIVTTIIIGLGLLTVSLMTFNLAGGETLSQMDNQKVFFVIGALLILILSLICANNYFKKDRKFTSLGILVTPIVLFSILTSKLIDNFKVTEFDKVIWDRSKFKPDDMTKSLVRKNKLVGLTKTEVLNMLGQGSSIYGKDDAEINSINYSIKNGWTLSLLFLRGRVYQVQLRQPLLGV